MSIPKENVRECYYSDCPYHPKDAPIAVCDGSLCTVMGELYELRKLKEKMPETEIGALTADGFDAAIIGVGQRCSKQSIVVYSANKCLEILEGQGMGEQEALDYFDFNVAGSWVGEGTPMFVWEVDAEMVVDHLAGAPDEEEETKGRGT